MDAQAELNSMYGDMYHFDTPHYHICLPKYSLQHQEEAART